MLEVIQQFQAVHVRRYTYNTFVTVVVAAVLEQHGKILVCQRRRGSRHELKWEFPGGKVEPGEEPRDALVRELQEELRIDAAIGAELSRYEFAYPGRTPILLIFVWAHRIYGRAAAWLRATFEACTAPTKARFASTPPITYHWPPVLNA